MPLWRNPPSLQLRSMCAQVNVILEMCENLKENSPNSIEARVKQIPKSDANFYVELLLRTVSQDSWTNYVSIRKAFHPKCSRINMERTNFDLTAYAYDQVISNLDVMKNLTELITGAYDADWWNRYESSKKVYRIPKMNSLRSLCVPQAEYPYYIIHIPQNCPNLEEINITCIPSVEIDLLSQCINLKVISVQMGNTMKFSGGRALRLLTALPTLEICSISNLQLEVFTSLRTFYVTDFLRSLHVDNIDSKVVLENLAVYFPLLESLRLIQDDNSDLHPINLLRNLTRLSLTNGKAQNLECLTSKCIPRLTRLVLVAVEEVYEIFTLREVRIQWPVLVALDLKHVTDIDLCAIDFMCPNLQNLGLVLCSKFRPLPECQESPAPFRKLKYLKIAHIPRDIMDYILTSDAVTLSKFHLSNAMHDKELHDIFEIKSLKHLCALCVDNDFMTPAAVSDILETYGSELSKVYLRSSKFKNMDRNTFQNMVDIIQTYHINFTIVDRIGHKILQVGPIPEN